MYPRASPGGWQLIGRTSAPLWDANRPSPALLTPGTTVAFTVARETVDLREPATTGGAAPPRDAAAGPALEIEAAALPVLVQDLGRPGFANIGVTRSGAVDRAALRAANRAVGNAPEAAALELTLGNAVLAARGDTVIALDGAELPAEIERATGHLVACRHGVAELLRDGDRLHLGTPTRGLRTVLAVRGGVDDRPVLGSRSTDTLAALGPAPRTAGDRVAIANGGRACGAVEVAERPPRPLPAPGDELVVHVRPGPRDEWFTPESRHDFATAAWLVTPSSNRVGVRLEGAVPLQRRVTRELESEALVPGSIQVPPNGQPIVFLADHPVTGGYPVIATVLECDLDLLGQAPPGARIRFRPPPTSRTGPLQPLR